MTEKLKVLQENAGIDVAVNGVDIKEDGSVERTLWFARSMEPFNASGQGVVRFFREVSLNDKTSLYFCPSENLIEAEKLMSLAGSDQRWFTFMEGQRFYAKEREMKVEVAQVIILDTDKTETKLTWSETKQCKGNRDLNELVACYLTASDEERIKKLFR